MTAHYFFQVASVALFCIAPLSAALSIRVSSRIYGRPNARPDRTPFYKRPFRSTPPDHVDEEGTSSSAGSPFAGSEYTRQPRVSDFPSSAWLAGLSPREGAVVKQSNLPAISNDSDAGGLSKYWLNTRVLQYRKYSQPGPFEAENLRKPPTLEDLVPPVKDDPLMWNQLGPKTAVVLGAFLAYPYIQGFLCTALGDKENMLSLVTSTFGPAISILYGTFISLTISILYSRQQSLQEEVSMEASRLASLTRNLLALLKDRREASVEAAQFVADQVRTLVKESRGHELVGIMYRDPYLAILSIVEETESDLRRRGILAEWSGLVGAIRDDLNQVTNYRSRRLVQESLALPPTHFSLLFTASAMTLLSFCLATLNAPGDSGYPIESRILFAIQTGLYVYFYRFCEDLNDPFDGVYVIRRSSTASHLLQIKWHLVNHPLMGDEIDFDECTDEMIVQGLNGSEKIPQYGSSPMNEVV